MYILTVPFRAQCDIFLAKTFSDSVQSSPMRYKKDASIDRCFADQTDNGQLVGCMTAAGHWMDIRRKMWTIPPKGVSDLDAYADGPRQHAGTAPRSRIRVRSQGSRSQTVNQTTGSNGFSSLSKLIICLGFN